MTIVVGGSRRARSDALAERVRACAGARVADAATEAWPFLRHVGRIAGGAGAVVIVARRLEDAFPDRQAAGARLVLTQSSYQIQRWLDWIHARGDAWLLAEADEASLRRCAPEALARRGPWSRVEWVDLGAASDVGTASDGPPNEDARTSAEDAYARLASCFRLADPDERLARCRHEADARPDDPVVRLALASVYMEVEDLDASQAAIERAIAAAPEWEAAHYELGKLMVRRDDLERASRAFAAAGRLMPSFSAAFSNLGATLGELDRGEEALAAFRQALRYDANGYTILNNIGVVSRELGRLSESEAAFRRVVSQAPEFVFGHYNLGHTLFLQGRYQAALSAYVEGQRRDPEKNARQACRLAVVRLAAGDADGSLRDIEQCTAAVPGDQAREILAEAQEILWALITAHPGLAGWRTVSDAVTSRLSALT